VTEGTLASLLTLEVDKPSESIGKQCGLFWFKG